MRWWWVMVMGNERPENQDNSGVVPVDALVQRLETEIVQLRATMGYMLAAQVPPERVWLRLEFYGDSGSKTVEIETHPPWIPQVVDVPQGVASVKMEMRIDDDRWGT